MLDRLKAALADRYAVERELGSGGMAIVFLARDLKHDREVAIKVLRPELAAALGTERYLQEIHIAARLNNPHILPLHDSGEADGLLYYVMPYVEGESLRDRLDREKQLPVEEALQIAREVATGLSYAHSQGVVHRDIKPENILLSGETAVITDFGIARAISAAGGTRLTATGIAIGTPTYMSPEQVAGDRELDARSDLYSLGCLLYEMLAGEPPFTGPTVEAVIGKHVSAPPPQVTVARSSVPAVISAAIQRALAKAPADRYATVSQFREAIQLESVSGERAVTERRSPLKPLAIATVVVAVLLAVVVLWPRGGARDVDPDQVAVMPFRVAGPGLEYLREGMVDLLAAKLTGEGGPRAVDQRTVLSAWRRAGGTTTSDLTQEDALGVAQSVGAGRLLQGSVVGTPQGNVLEATLVEVPGGRPLAQARVEGASDSLHFQIDDLTAQLLARQAGEAEQRLASLTSTSLGALKAYLDGEALFRRGQYTEAADRFGRAVELDPTFALAALGLVSAKQWTVGGFDSLGVDLAWRHRDRLSRRDRAQAAWFAGSRYPEPSNTADRARNLELWLEAAPDRPDAWYWGGEGYYHFGALIDAENYRERSTEFFRRAFELDSNFTAPVIHLISLAADRGDSAGVRRLSTHYLGIDSTGNMADFVRWRSAIALGNEEALAQLRTRFETMSTQSLAGLMGEGIEGGFAMEDVDRAAEVLERRPEAPSQRFINLLRVHDTYLARGRPSAALRVNRAIEVLNPGASATLDVLDAVYAGGDSAAAAAAAQQLDAWVASLGQSNNPNQAGAACGGSLWHAVQGQTDGLSEPIALLRQVRSPPADAATYHVSVLCAATLEALLAAAGGGSDLRTALAQLDSLVQVGFAFPWQMVAVATLTSARLHERRGDRESALAAVRRRMHYAGTYLAPALREEGRLAAQLGDREGAVRAYEHYLTLMSDPERSLQPDVEQVRAELARLVGEGAGL